MNTFRTNGVDLAGEERGEGELLVFVHGAVGDLRTWNAQVEDCSTRYRVITYSRRWHHPNAQTINCVPYTVDIHVADLTALLMNHGPAHLVGHSYGASVCALVAAQNPEVVRSLVLAEPSLFSLLTRSPTGVAALAQAAAASTSIVSLARQGRNQCALREFLNTILGPGGFERVPASAREVMLDNLHTLEPMLAGMNRDQMFTPELAARIGVPTLLVDGAETPALFRTVLDELEQHLPDARRITLPALSHGLHLEDSDAFSRAVLDFLTEIEAPLASR